MNYASGHWKDSFSSRLWEGQVLGIKQQTSLRFLAER